MREARTHAPWRRFGAVAVALVMGGCGLSIVGETAPPASDAPPAAHEDATSILEATALEDATPLDADLVADAADGNEDATADATADADAASKPLFGDDCPVGTIYNDDFSTNPTTRWLTVAGQWTWSSVAKSYTASSFNPHAVTWIGPRPKWKDYVIEVVLTGTAPTVDHGDVGPIFRIGTVGSTIPAPNNAGQMYLAGISFLTAFNTVLGRFANGNYYGLQTGSNSTDVASAKVTIRVEVVGQSIKVLTNNNAAINTTDTTYASGSIGIRTYQAGVTVYQVKVTCR